MTAQSHGIVREHRGELDVESAPGQYTRFHVNLRVDNGWAGILRPRGHP